MALALPWATTCTTTVSRLAATTLRLMTTSSPRSVMWPPDFEDPVWHKRDLPELKKSGEFDRKRIVPIKAAINDANCSIFADDLLRRFRNTLMMRSDKEMGDRIIRRSFELIKAKQLDRYRRAPDEDKDDIVIDPTTLLGMAVENARPLLGIEMVKRGSVVYQVPVPISETRSVFEAIRWIIQETRDRDKKASMFYEKLADVIVDTAMYSGKVIERKHEHHRICEQNRAYANFRRAR